MPERDAKDQRDPVVRMVMDRFDDYLSLYAACESIAPKLGIGSETRRRWIVQSQVDSVQRVGPTSDELAEIKTLNSKVRDLEEANDILKPASISFRGSASLARPFPIKRRQSSEVHGTAHSRPSLTRTSTGSSIESKQALLKGRGSTRATPKRPLLT